MGETTKCEITIDGTPSKRVVEVTVTETEGDTVNFDYQAKP